MSEFKKQLLRRVLITVAIVILVPAASRLLFPQVGFHYLWFIITFVLVMMATVIIDYIDHRKAVGK